MRKGVLYFVIVAACYISCGGPDGSIGPDGLNSLIRTSNEPAGTNCQFGGLRIDSGLDSNADGILVDNEVSSTEYVCNTQGSTGLNSLIRTSNESAGINCQYGGLRVESGLDSNANGVLNDNEVSNTEYVCSTPGPSGTPGSSGKNSLLNVVNVPSGADCANGGLRIDSGVDDNENDVLDEEEIQVVRFLCNTAGGGFQEEIRLRFGENYTVTTGTNWFMRSDQTEHLINFNKANYPGADSVVVGMSLATGSFSSRCFGELYNVTDFTSIANSQLESNLSGEASRQYVYSGNIINDLPDHQISLALRIRSEVAGTVASGGFPTYIFIYRNSTP